MADSPTNPRVDPDQLIAALAASDSSVRLKANLLAGTYPDVHLVDPLVGRCGVEPDFYVREMLTWALIQHPRDLVIPRLERQLGSPTAQARSQALHTLSKLVVPEAWPWVFPSLLTDAEDEVARTAWRGAVGIVPDGEEAALLEILLSQLGRGDLEMKKSLARALVDLEIRGG